MVFYHVMCREDRREAIFQDDQDRERFLATVEKSRVTEGKNIYSSDPSLVR